VSANHRVLKAEQTRDQALSALEEMNRNLERRVEERTEQLEIANRELEAFSYSVSHDLRTPLQQIIGFTGLLKEDCVRFLNPTSQGYLDRIEDGIVEMRKLIDDLLRLAKFSSVELKTIDTDLSAIALEICGNLRHLNPNRPVDFQIQPDLSVRGDPGLLKIVLENLFSNAWKYTAREEHAVIEFGSGVSSGEMHYFVRDNGVGFDMRHADKLFAPFQRFHSQQEYPGHGVGLATVHRIIKRHGGHLWAEAEPHKGAVFYFTIPES
jgi:signal transduction histidine kinase